MVKKAVIELARELGGKKLCKLVSREEINLEKAWDFLRRMDLVLPRRADYRHLFFREIEENMLQDWLNESQVNNGFLNLLDKLAEHLWLPLPETARALEQGQDLDGIIDLMHGGYFNPKNELHLELEYSWNCFNGEGRNLLPLLSVLSFEAFKTIPMPSSRGVSLNEIDDQRITACAREAVEVFKVIRQRQEEVKQPLLVIGNERYGRNFVIEPLEEQLQKLGCQVVYEYVRSTDVDCDENYRFELSKKTRDKIKADHSPLVIVDGTKVPKYIRYVGDDIKKWTRFPAAVKGYMNFLERRFPNTYDFCFWAPNLTGEQFYINHRRYSPPNDHEGLKQALFISSTTTEDEDGSGGCYDDVERYIHNNRLAFTTSGIALRQIACLESEFLGDVQEKMREKIKEYL